MSNFDYFKQYQAEQERIRRKIEEEENPIHREHLVQIEKMIDEKIQSQVPAMLQNYNEKQRVEVETYLNGKRIRNNSDFVKGIRDMIADAFKSTRRGR